MLGQAFRQLKSWLQGSEVGQDVSELQQRVLVVHNADDAYAVGLYENVLTSLRYCRLASDSWDIMDRAGEPLLHGYTCVLLCTEFLQNLDVRMVNGLRDYVRRGGGLAVVYRGWNPDLRELFGIEQGSEWPEFSLNDDAGIEFTTNTFHGFENLRLSGDEISGHVPYDILPVQDAMVLARNARGRPVAWLRAEGAGRVLYWNSTILAEPVARGLIVQAIAGVQPKAVLPIANIGLIHVDDFPPSAMDVLPEPAATEFPDATADDFYYGIWHADMLATAAEYGITYTYFAILDYTDAIPDREPGPDASRAADDIPEFFNAQQAELAMRFGELGFHGYCHRPLLAEHWESAESMKGALALARRIWLRWQDYPPVSYVPPGNEFDAAGATALAATFPELEAICSTYLQGDFHSGGMREFGPEPWAPALYGVPRATSGFELSPITRFEMTCQLATFGVWTHFVHPDDVFDTPGAYPGAAEWRNPHSRFWRANGDDGRSGMLAHFRDWLALVRTAAPWLRYMDTRSAVPRLKAYFESRFDARIGDRLVRIDAPPGSHFHIRVNDLSRLNPLGIRNATLLSQAAYDGYALYTFEATAAEVEIEFA